MVVADNGVKEMTRIVEPKEQLSTAYILESDEVEAVRGALASLSNVGNGRVRELHTNSIRNSVAQRTDASRYRYGLAALTLLREIQPLSNGFWLPTPARQIIVDGHSLLIAPIPTNRLEFEFPSLYRSGFGRVLDLGRHCDLPIQDFESWVGERPPSLRSWGLRKMELLISSLKPTIHRDNFEYLDLQTRRDNATKKASFDWGRSPKMALPDHKDIFLCREQIGTSRYVFFLVQIAGRIVRAEAQILSDVLRFQYFLALHSGLNFALTKLASGVATHIGFRNALPKEETRILAAFGKRLGWINGQKTYAVPNALTPIIFRTLANLGYDEGTNLEH